MLSLVSQRDSTAPSVPLFISDRIAPRRRRPSDIARLCAAIVTFGLLGWASSSGAPIDSRVAGFLGDLPDWLRTVAWFGFTVSGLVALIVAALGVALGGFGRGLMRDLAAASLMAVAIALISSRLTHGSWPNLVPEIDRSRELPSYPMLRSSLVVLVSLVLGPYVNVGVQRWVRWTSVIAITSPLLLGLTTVTSMIGAISLSVLCVAAVRLAFGSPEGLPSLDRLRVTLERIGISVTELAYLEVQPGTVGLATATSSDGRSLDIKVFGIDAASRQQAERVWKAMWYRTAGPAPRAGRAEQAQHEALAVLMARDAGVSVPPMIGAGQTADDDVLVVSGSALGVTLDDHDDLDDATLRLLWRDLTALHEDARISHGTISSESVRVLDGRAEFVDFANSSTFPTEQQLATDVVSMLATQAIEVGADRALDAALDAVPVDALTVSLPYVQNAVLEPKLRTSLADSGVKIKSLHAGLSERLQIETAPLASVRRVKISDLVIAVAAIIAANALISQISDVGLDTLVDEVQGASIGWLSAAFAIRMVAYATAYFGLKAVVTQQLPFLPTAILQSAKSFVGLVVPSLVGSVSMNIRFLQNLGVPFAVASTQGPVIGFIGFIAEIVLLALCAWSIGQEVETDGLLDFDSAGLIAIAIGVAAIGVIVVLSIPKFRNVLIPAAREAFASVKSIVSSPRALGAIFGSEAIDRIISALALGATMSAFGAHIPFAALIFVSVGTGLLAGLAPVPGGIGVAEATMTGLLTSVGLPASQAVTIAIVHRVITSYLPPVIGFFSLRWLNKEGYL